MQTQVQIDSKAKQKLRNQRLKNIQVHRVTRIQVQVGTNANK